MIVVVVSVRWNVRRYASHTGRWGLWPAISVAPPIQPSLSYPVLMCIWAETCTRECEFGLHALQ